MTASATISDRAACLAVGMDDLLPKPWTEQQLAEVLGRLRERTAGYTASTVG
jgi:CheY-like chemotaxis protein